MPPTSRVCVRVACACLVVLLGIPALARAQLLPATPITTAGGRLTVSGEASASLSPNDEYYFNYSDYDYNLLRQVRFDAAGAFRVNPRLSLLGDLRVEGAIGEGSWRLRPYALFVRVRPWPLRAFDVQAGLIPPVFGAFSRHAYGSDNPLIGFPLGYQYLTSLRADALPALEIVGAVTLFQAAYGVQPKTLWLQNHGLIAMGGTAKEAESATRMSVKAAEVALGALQAGKAIRWLEDREIQQIASWPDEHYRQRQLWG